MSENIKRCDETPLKNLRNSVLIWNSQSLRCHLLLILINKWLKKFLCVGKIFCMRDDDSPPLMLCTSHWKTFYPTIEFRIEFEICKIILCWYKSWISKYLQTAVVQYLLIVIISGSPSNYDYGCKLDYHWGNIEHIAILNGFSISYIALLKLCLLQLGFMAWGSLFGMNSELMQLLQWMLNVIQSCTTVQIWCFYGICQMCIFVKKDALWGFVCAQSSGG